MVNYKCYRCGKDFGQKCHILNHLVRKNPCKSVLKEIDNCEILRLNKIEEYNKDKYKIPIIYPKKEDNILKKSVKKENNICDYCNKVLSSYKNKWRHEKTCKVKLQQINTDEKMRKLEEDNKILLNKLMELSNKIDKKGSGSIKGNNNVNNNNTTNNIQINNFDCERVDYFTEKLAFQIAKRYPLMIGRFVEHLHFNKNYPENHTIKIKDAKSGLGQIRVDGSEKNYIMDDFLEEVSHNLKDKLYELSQIIPDERQDEFDLLYDDAMDLLENLKTDKKVKKRIKAACINGTSKIVNVEDL